MYVFMESCVAPEEVEANWIWYVFMESCVAPEEVEANWICYPSAEVQFDAVNQIRAHS